MNGPRGYCMKSDKGKLITYMWNLKYDTNKLSYKPETHRHRKQIYGYQGRLGTG